MTQEAPERADAGTSSPVKGIFRAWERLRLVYNAALVLVVMLSVGPEQEIPPAFWLFLACQAVLANLCFFAGPLAEWYVGWLGYRSRATRWVLFGAGLLFAVVLAADSLRGPWPWQGGGM
jgi:hypothetical protein